MKNNFVAGIDVGGSHITAAIINITTGELIQKTIRRKHINSHGDYLDIIREWTSVINSSFNSLALLPDRMGIAMPGPFDYEEGICLINNQDKYDSLYGLNVKVLLSECLLVPPQNIVLTNDAACFLYGELFNGAAKDCKDAVGLTLGTGLGSAIVKKGKVVDAEWWCAPYLDGIAEDYLSTRWFIKRYNELTGEQINNVKALLSENVNAGISGQVFNEFGRNLGEFLGTRKLNESVETLVLGGNIANAFHLFENSLQQALHDHSLYLSVKPAELGENAALIGAASSCYKKSYEAVAN